jgi:hypothetical protein
MSQDTAQNRPAKNVIERYDLIIGAGNYSAAECHDIAKWLCAIRDFEDQNTVAEVERMLQAFINRKRLGTPVTTKALEREFGFPP